MEDLNIINKEDKEYYDNFYLISMYLGAGVETISFGVYANDANQALEIAVAHAEIDRPNVLYDFDSIRDYVYVTYEDEYNEWLEDKSGEDYSYDESWFDFAQEYLGYIYVDGTEYGATQPYFIEGSNLRIEETNDEPITFDESKKEELFDNSISVNANDIGSNNSTNLDLGGLGDIGSLLGESEKKEELFNNSINIDAGDILSNNNTSLDLGGIGALAGLLASEAERVADNKLEEETSEEIENWLDKNFMRFRQFIARDEFEDIMAKIVTNGNKEEYDTMPVGKAMRIILSKIGIDKTEDYMKQLDEIDRNYARQYAGVTENKELKEETIQAVADIATKIRKAKNEVGKEDFNYDEFVSEIKQDTMRLSDRTEQETAATLLQDFCKEFGNRERNQQKCDDEICRESKELKTEYYQMPEDEHIIWDSEDSVDDYDMDEMKDIYQDYVDNFNSEQQPMEFDKWLDSDDCANYFDYEWEEAAKENSRYEEWADFIIYYVSDEEKEEAYNEYVERCKNTTLTPDDFETWFDNYRIDMSDEVWSWKEDDLKENIFPEIDKQLNDDILLLSGSYSSNYADFRPSGEGGVMFEKGTDEFRQYMGNFDRVCITTQNGILGAICNDHDGTVSGQFYTLPDDKSELIKAMGYEKEGRKVFDEYDDYGNFHIADYENVEEFLKDYMPQQFEEDIYYGGIDASDLNKHIDLLKPIKDTISGYAPTDPDKTKTESKEDLDINSNENYKKIHLTYKCDDCGHTESFLIDNMTEKELAREEASDSSTFAGNCPKCGSIYYNLKDYEIMEENKKVKTESRYATKEELEEVAKAYCKKMGYEFIFANEDKFGFETKDGQLWTLDYFELADKLKALEQEKKTESVESIDLEKLANDIIDWYGADMGIWFDEIQGNEEEIFNETMAILENRDEKAIKNMLDDIQDTDLDDKTAEDVNIATTKSLVDRLSTLLKDTKTEALEISEKIYLDPTIANRFDEETKLNFENVDLNALKIVYGKLEELVETIYENRAIDNVKDELNVRLSRAGVKIENLPQVSTVQEAFNLAQVVRKQVSDKLVEEFGYDALYENKEVKTEDVEYISQKELDDMPDDYKTTVGDTIRNSWEGKEKLTKLYKDLGYDEDDPMILARDDVKGTILKPVKVKKEEQEKKTEDIMAGEWLSKENKDEYSNGTIWAELDLNPDYIEVDYENEDTDEEWLDKVFRTMQTKATDYDVQITNINPAPNGYTVILKGTLQDIVDFIYDQKGYSIDKCIEDSDVMVAKRPIEERFLGPSDEVIADSKAKGLYTEDDNAGAKEEIKNDLGIEPGSDEEAQLDSIFDEQNELSEEGLATEFKVGDVVTDIVDNDTAVIEAGPDTYDSTEESHRGKYLLRFVDGVCKGDAYWYTKGRFELVKDEKLIKDALEIYNNNMKPEDNPLKTESEEIRPVKNYKDIDAVWEDITSSKSKDEVETIIEMIPDKFGIFTVQDNGNYVTVINVYENGEMGTQEDKEDIYFDEITENIKLENKNFRK